MLLSIKVLKINKTDIMLVISYQKKQKLMLHFLLVVFSEGRLFKYACEVLGGRLNDRVSVSGQP